MKCLWCFLIIYISAQCIVSQGPGGSMSQEVGLPNNSYKPITNTAWVRTRLCKLQNWCIRLAVASDKVYQLLAHGRWFSLGTPSSSTSKAVRHDIAEILLKVALSTKIQISKFKFIGSHQVTFHQHQQNKLVLAMIQLNNC